MANEQSSGDVVQAAGTAATPGEANIGVQAIHQAELDAGRFLIQRCSDCARYVYFPREHCLHCGGAELRWAVPAGTGTVYATTTNRRKPEVGGDYNISLIDLDEGVRMMSRVDGIAPAQVRIGLRVRARIQVIEGRGLVLFDAIPSSGGAGETAP